MLIHDLVSLVDLLAAHGVIKGFFHHAALFEPGAGAAVDGGKMLWIALLQLAF